MSAFRFRAVGQDGRTVTGEIEAATLDDAIERLRGQGVLPIAVRAGKRLLSITGDRKSRLAAVSEEALFSGLADLLEGGLTLDQSLDLLSSTADGATGRRIAQSLLRLIRSGDSLSAAMERVDVQFDTVTLALVRAGEEGGQLSATLQGLADLAERRRMTAEKLRSALAYPLIVLLTAAFAIGFILIVVVPGFMPLFEQSGSDMPASMARLLSLRAFLIANGWLLPVLGLVLWLVGKAVASLPGTLERWHAFLLRLTWLGPLLAASDIARFARTLGSMLEAGIPLAAALPLAGDTLKNQSLHQAVTDACSQVQAGNSLSQSLKAVEGLPVVVGHLLRVSEAAGQPATMLRRIADLCDREVRGKTDRILALMPALLIVGLGGLVAMIVSMLLGAVLDVNQAAL